MHTFSFTHVCAEQALSKILRQMKFIFDGLSLCFWVLPTGPPGSHAEPHPGLPSQARIPSQANE